jgi:hypothetical protein
MTEVVLFTTYDRSTGQVLSSGSGYSPQVLETADVGVLVGARYDLGWIDGGAYHPLPPKPSEHHVFDYTTKQWVDPRTPETEWELVRAERNRRLVASDWTQLPDVAFVDQQEWAVYRQALRDVTNQQDPFNIVWPVPPPG